MNQTVIPAGASLRPRRLRDIARACTAEHAAALASMCAFALLGAPLTGTVVAALIAQLQRDGETAASMIGRTVAAGS
jgi:hypothetical protein